jgi:hypothetical protein
MKTGKYYPAGGWVSGKAINVHKANAVSKMCTSAA